MNVEIEVPQNLIDSLEVDPENFVEDAVRDRRKMFFQSTRLLRENGWSKNEIEWAIRALGCCDLFPDIQEAAEEELGLSEEWSHESPLNDKYGISDSRSNELIDQFREDGQLATALIFAARVYDSFDTVP